MTTNETPTHAHAPHAGANSLSAYMSALVSELQGRGRVRTAETYASALANFLRFRGGSDIGLDAITAETIGRYEAYMQSKGNTPNTTSFYMRILRAVYNRAVEARITEDRAPFRHVYTGVGKTPKRALPLTVIRAIKNFDLCAQPRIRHARDMFMLSFYLRGMSFIDMAYLRKTDLCRGYVTYRRHKTGQALSVKWTAAMQDVIDRYPPNAAPYLLPILTDPAHTGRRDYRNAAYNANSRLKKLGRLLGLPVPLTMYCARHSWATAALAKGVPVSVISEGLGHDSEATTRIYLASLSTTAVDRANALIIRSL